jgi:hypothetical protein
MTSHRLSLDAAYFRWWAQFQPFEARCLAAVCEFVRMHFDDLLDRYYREGHESLNAFSGWVFECYLREIEGTGMRDDTRWATQARMSSSGANRRSP